MRFVLADKPPFTGARCLHSYRHALDNQQDPFNYPALRLACGAGTALAG